MNLNYYFRRKCPTGVEYSTRLHRELALIKKFGFENTFIQIREILDLIPEYRHVTRGSAGCSLVAYLMGIHNLDPIENKFSLSRFMHEQRKDLPDVDLDFAHNQRDLVLERVFKKYGNRVGRISNHVYYRKKSAMRESIRRHGHRKFVPKIFNFSELAGEHVESIENMANDLEGKIKNYSLHCGGIVIFPNEVPKELLLKGNQLKLNKDEVEEKGLIKVDLLCNRALSQLNDLSDKDISSYPFEDKKVTEMFAKGDSLGLTFAESPAQRRICKKIGIKNRDDIVFALALIRPLPSADGRKLKVIDHYVSYRNSAGFLVYDDDGIKMIMDAIACSESDAELYRKGFAKKDIQKIEEFKTKLGRGKESLVKELSYFSLYSFCRAHARSYGELVWALAYEKSRNPWKFWVSCLNHAQSMYRRWVHVEEAKKSGLNFVSFGKGNWKLQQNNVLVEKQEFIIDSLEQYKKYGWWTSKNFIGDCFYNKIGNFVNFKGLIGCCTHHTVGDKDLTFITAGSGGSLFDIVIPGIYDAWGFDTISGFGEIKDGSLYVENPQFDYIEKKYVQKLLF